MTLLSDVLDVDNLELEIQDGFISRRFHPEYPELAILNYTEKAAFAQHWNNETRTCRGLIYNTSDGEVLARPFAKFFNYGQAGAPDIDLDAELYWVGDKADGSLGIAFVYDEQIQIATRGSFASDQAAHANEWLGIYDGAIVHEWIWDAIDAGDTPLFEIIYPENRIVLNYGDDDYLHFLGSVHISDGAYYPPTEGPVREYKTFREVLEAPVRKNAEGWVAWIDPWTAVKIKQEDYVELHRIVTGLNRKSVWRALKDGKLQALLEQLPDELYEWANNVAEELFEAYMDELRAILTTYTNVLGKMEREGIDLNERKQFAISVQHWVAPEYRGYMFSLADERDISQKIWATLEPVGNEKV